MQKGFSIIETLVAISIASIVLAGLASVVVIAFRGYVQGQRMYIASSLTQEGMEMVANKIKNNERCMNNDDCDLISDWQDGVIGSFKVDINNTDDLIAGKQWASSTPSDPEYLCMMDNGKYGYCESGGGLEMPAHFTREVVIKAVSANITDARVTVTWTSPTKRRVSSTYQELFYGGKMH